MSENADKFLDAGSADSFLDAAQGADSFLDGDAAPDSLVRKAFRATAVPVRGLRGIGVGVEKMFTGDQGDLTSTAGFKERGAEALTRGAAATEPDYKPEKGEKIGYYAGDMLDPRFMALGAVGELGAASKLGKAALAGASALGGVEAIDEYGKEGKLDPKKIGVQAAAGAVTAGVLSKILPPLVRAIKASPELMATAIKNIRDFFNPEAAEKLVADLAKETAATEAANTAKGASEAIDASEGAKADLKGQERHQKLVDAILGKEPPPDILKPKVVDIKGSPETTSYLQRLYRLAERPRSAEDLATQKARGIIAEQTAEEVRGKLLSEGSGAKLPFEEQAKASAPVGDLLDQGKSHAEIAKEAGVPEPVVKQAAALADPIRIGSMEVQEAAAGGDQKAQLGLLQRAMARFMRAPSEALSSAKNLFQRRYGDIGLGHLDSYLFIKGATKGLNAIERKAMPFIIEGALPDPARFQHDDAEAIYQTAKAYLDNPDNPLLAHLKEAHQKIGAYYDEGHAFLKDVFDDIGYRENYVNHIWGDKAGEAMGAGRASMKNPFTKERVIASFADGINAGFDPRTLDIGELLTVYDNFKIKSVANKRFLMALQNLTVVENGKIVNAVLPVSEAPRTWKVIDNMAMRIKGEPAAVSPEIQPAVAAVFDKPFAFTDPGPHALLTEKAAYRGVKAYEAINAYFKTAKLSLSLFHHVTLGITALESGINPLKVAGKSVAGILRGAEFDGIRDMPAALYKSFMEGHPAFDNLELARDAIGKGGLHINALPDAQSSRMQKMLMDAERSVKNPALQAGMKGVRTFNQVWDKGLWDYWHAQIKLLTYYQHLQQNIARYGETMTLDEIKRETGAFINKESGGAMDTWMVSPKTKQILHWTLLAPDWTITRLQTFGAMFKGGPQGFQARRFGLRAALGWFAAANAINYVNTKKHLGEGRFIWDNDLGRKTHVFWGKAENGQNNYAQLNKSFTEIIEWFTDPIKTLGGKAAPAIHLMAEILSKEQRTLSGYAIPKDERNVKGFLKRNVLPITMGGSSAAMALPLSHGMSKTAVIEMLQDGFTKGDNGKIETALKFGVENGYNVGTLKDIALRNYRQEIKKAALK